MTLQDIFKRVRFENLKEYLIEMDPQVSDNLYAFKEAFDILCMMEAKKGIDAPITIERVIDEWDGKPFLSVYFKVREEWECTLSRPVVVDEHTVATIEEIAASVLWEITFYGFSPEEEYNGVMPIERIGEFNPYKEQYLKIKQRHHDTNCKYKSDIGQNTYSIKNKSDLYWKPRKNGPKRHREKRLALRTKTLEKKMKRWELVFRLKVQNGLCDDIVKWLHDEIMNGNTFQHYCLESRTQVGNDIDYMVELIRDYFPPKKGSKSIILVSAPEILSSGNELKCAICEVFGSFRKLPAPQYIFTTNNERKNIRIDLLVFE